MSENSKKRKTKGKSGDASGKRKRRSRVVSRTSRKTSKPRDDGEEEGEAVAVSTDEDKPARKTRTGRKRVRAKGRKVATRNAAGRSGGSDDVEGESAETPRRDGEEGGDSHKSKVRKCRDADKSSGKRTARRVSRSAVRRDKSSKAPEESVDEVVPLQPTFLPAKSKGFGCRWCKYYQYVKGANLTTWKGTRRPETTESGKAYKALTHCLMGVGPKNADVMIVGEAPGATEDKEGRPFCGMSGTLLEDGLKIAGLARSDVYITNVVKCRPPNNETPSYTNSAYCSGYLSREIQNVKPKIIVAAGKVALQAIAGSRSMKVTEAHGHPYHSTVAGHECVVFPMWHPAYVLRNDHLTERYAEAFNELRKIMGKFGTDDAGVEKDEATYHVLTNPDDCVNVLKEMTNTDDITFFDFETSSLNAFGKGQRVAILSVAKDELNGYAIPLFARLEDVDDDSLSPPEEIRKLGWTKESWHQVIEESRKYLLSTSPKVGHNVKFDMNWGQQVLDARPFNVIADSMLEHYAFDETSVHELKTLAVQYTPMGAYDNELDMAVKKTGKGKDKRYDLVPLPMLGKYAAMDSVATLLVHDAMCEAIDEQGEETARVAFDVLPRALNSVQNMESHGSAIDLDFARELQQRYADEMDSIEAQMLSDDMVQKFTEDMRKEKGKKFEFSTNSPVQMCELFFGEKYFNFTPLEHKKTKAGWSTDKEVMQYLIDTYDCKMAKLKQEWGLTSKLKSTYVDRIINDVMSNNDARLHGSFNLSGTKTGRLSSSNPNLQNIPNKGSGAVKRMFVSRFGHEGCIIQADYSQIELRMMASIAQDRRMMKVYRDGKDIHAMTTLRIFSNELKKLSKKKEYRDCKDLEEVLARVEEKKPHEHKKMRTIAKRINFGIAYGIGAPGIVDLLRGEGIVITQDEARDYIDKFMKAYPEVARWIEMTHRQLRRDGQLMSVYGRIRRLPEVFSEDHELQSRAERQGTNFLIQDPASDTTLTALTLIEECLREHGFESVPYLTVHDSIVIDAKREEAVEVIEIVKHIMEDIAEFVESVWPGLDNTFLTRVPIRADVEVGVNWRDVVKLNNPEDLSDALIKSELKESESDKVAA